MRAKISTGNISFHKLSDAIAYAVVDSLRDKAYRMFENSGVYLASIIECEEDEANIKQTYPDFVEVEVKEYFAIDCMKFAKFDFTFMTRTESNLWAQIVEP